MSNVSVAEPSRRESHLRHVELDRARHRLFHLRDLGESVLLGQRLVLGDHAAVPVGRGERREELSVLPREIFVMQMNPVVLMELAVQNLGIPELRVRDLRVVERELDRVVPGRRARRHVDRDTRRRLELHDFHVVVGDLGDNLRHCGLIDRLDRHASDHRLARDAWVVGQEKRPAAVVEEPLPMEAPGQRPVHEAVGAEVVGLGLVHRNQDPGRRDTGR
jgi:hypothetical protein